MRRKLVVLLLLFSFTPSLAELVEWTTHFITHGDFAHSHDAQQADPGAQDCHGCSGLFHPCGRDARTSSTPPRPARLALVDAPPSPASELIPLLRTGRAAEPPPHRPPIG